MRLFRSSNVFFLALGWGVIWVLFHATGTAAAQRHDMGSSPPTAPPSKPETPHTVLAAPPNLGPLTFLTDNVPVSAPQALVAQLRSADDLTRAGALVAVGAPAWYLEQGTIPTPHSIHLDLLPLGDSRELDAILTVELDHHIISAVLIPGEPPIPSSTKSTDKDQSPGPAPWRRIATLTYPTNFDNPATTPGKFLLAERSLLNPLRYTAVFHTTANGPNRDFKETEVRLQIFASHAVIIAGFTSSQRSCDPTHQHPCQVTQRWIQADAADPRHRFTLVTATGYEPQTDPGAPIARSRIFADLHRRNFTCQTLAFSSTILHFESLANPTACFNPDDSVSGQPLH
ncbi:MAG: hypothetical protein ACP5E5_08705 [Acidobacteriaceae bacterium]